MTVYTVHEPRPRKNADSTDPDRFVFVRDGFYFWAFLLVLLLYLVATTAVQAGLWALGLSAAVKFSVGLLFGLLVGFEAASLQRWTFARRRWNNLGLVVAPDLESAERRFFDAWIARHSAPRAAPSPRPPASPSAPPAARIPPSAPEVIGLFPEPEPRPRS
jgi:hypothetical protein